MNYVIELCHQTTLPNYLTMYTWCVRCVCVCVCVCLRESTASVQERSSASTLPRVSLSPFGKQPGHTMNVLDETNSTTSLAATIPATSAAPAALAFSAASSSAAFPSLNERNAPVPTTLSV